MSTDIWAVPSDERRDVAGSSHSDGPESPDHTVRVRRSPQSATAWRDWCQFVYPRVYYAIYRMTRGDQERTADLTQEALERFLRYRAVERVTTDPESIAYLVRTAERINLDATRESIVRRRTQDGLRAIAEEHLRVDADEVANALDLERLISRLGEPDAQVLRWLRNEKSLGEIAKSLGISYSAAATRVHRAKVRLRKIAEGS